MTQDLETVMKNALDGRFFSFTHNDAGGMKVVERAVSKDYLHDYCFESQDAAKRNGHYSRINRATWAVARRKTFWTKAKTSQLTKHYHAGHSARRIGRMLGIGRDEVGLKLNELGLLSRYGVPYRSYVRTE